MNVNMLYEFELDATEKTKNIAKSAVPQEYTDCATAKE